MRRVICVVLATAALAAPALAQGRATVREFQQTITTYPYSDPDPIPAAGRIYPYFRFDGYTDTPVQQAWTVVELENAYLKVRVLPQIGGKVWTAIDKTSGRPFLYDNGVVKFRDIAMRGPWTSGGIEANYGIIGHTPNCATPVDYVAREHDDGSASVVIGVLDLLTRTPWRLEVRLPADAAYFTTRSLWQNTAATEQPYYTWMNVGLKSAGGLQFIYPGTHYIGHDGEASAWPVHPGNGKDLSYYDRNDFGPYKSYHVVGRHTDFFGAYWHDEDFGMARYSTRDDKPGKKIWIWGLSQQGMIWERLLTDTSGQYVEVQSGRLLNQSAEASVRSPFKHRGFTPALTDTWTEYWFPVTGTRGFVQANAHGALNVTREGAGWRLRFSPLRRFTARVEVRDGETPGWSETVEFSPLRPWTAHVALDIPAERLRVRIGGSLVAYSGDASAGALARPLAMPEDFDWDSAQGLHLKGKALVRQREYARARESLEAALARDAHYVPALVDLAHVKLRALDAGGAFALARRALAIDTYEPAANYYYGLAAQALGRNADARDGFEIAAQSIEYRAAAWHQLARLAAREGDLPLARHYASRLVESGGTDVDARQLLAALLRLDGDRAGALAASDEVLVIDPLNHHARVERFLMSGSDRDRAALVEGVRNEMPHETFLELASWYRALGRDEDAARVLALSPQQAEVLYWRAFLASHAPGEEANGASAQVLRQALAAPLDFVMPFRAESLDPLAWAASQTDDWRPKYLVALVHLGLGNRDTARTWLEACGDAPAFAPFYAVRAAARDASSPAAARADLERAAALDPKQWRFGRLLADHLSRGGQAQEALSVVERYHATFPASYVLGMLHARMLLLNGRAKDAAGVLATLRVLPYEGATEGRHLHRMAQLALAADALRAGDTRAALRSIAEARQWPEHLGAGKPYPADVDESVEDAFEWRALTRAGRATEAGAVLDRLRAASPARGGAGLLAAALTLREAGLQEDADAAFAQWIARGAQGPLADWGRRVLAGEAAVLPASVAATDLYAAVDRLAATR